MSVSKARLEAVLEVTGKGRFPLISFGCDISLNAIPTASCCIALGRDMASGAVSNANDALLTLRRYDKAKVYFRAIGDYAPGVPWPNKTVTIWNGRIEGIGTRCVSGQYEMVLYMRHWLAYLDNSSTVSSLAHPGNPLDLTFSALLQSANTTSKMSPSSMAHTAAGAHFVDEWHTVSANLWGDGFKALFWHFASNAGVANVSGNLTACDPTLLNPQSPNGDILSALKNIRGESTLQPDSSLGLPAYAPPLALTGVDSLPHDVVRSIADSVGAEYIGSFAQQTIWGKLLAYAGQYMFAVVPQIDYALVVPYIPAIREVYCKEISVDSKDAQQFTLQASRSLRAVAIYNSEGSTTGVMGADNATFGIGGCYAPSNPDPNGLIWVIPPPAWLAGLPYAAWSPRRTTALKTNQINSATTPMAVNQNLKPNAAPATFMRTVEDVSNGYAHTIYAMESLRGRVGQVSDKLRFDIAPGSIVRLNSVGDPFLINGRVQPSLIGSVIGLSIAINAEQGSAGVNFQIEFLRTEAENNADDSSVERHPLYENTFVGAPLVDDLQFGNC